MSGKHDMGCTTSTMRDPVGQIKPIFFVRETRITADFHGAGKVSKLAPTFRDSIKCLTHSKQTGFCCGELRRSVGGLTTGVDHNSTVSIMRCDYETQKAMNAAQDHERAIVDQFFSADSRLSSADLSGAGRIERVGRVVWEKICIPEVCYSDSPWPSAMGELMIERRAASRLVRFLESDAFKALLRDPRLKGLEGVSLALLDVVDPDSGRVSDSQRNPTAKCIANFIFLFSSVEKDRPSSSEPSVHVTDFCKVAADVFSVALKPFCQLNVPPNFKVFEIEFISRPLEVKSPKVCLNAPVAQAYRSYTKSQHQFMVDTKALEAERRETARELAREKSQEALKKSKMSKATTMASGTVTTTIDTIASLGSDLINTTVNCSQEVASTLRPHDTGTRPPPTTT